MRQLQKQRRDEDGYVKVTVILLLDKRRPLASVADDLGLDETTVYRYARAFTTLGVDQYLLQQIINTTFYRTKGLLRTAVLDFFTRLPDFGPDLASLLTCKFHILDAQLTS